MCKIFKLGELLLRHEKYNLFANKTPSSCNKFVHCSIVTNLAEPTWISVECKQNLLHNILCVESAKNSVTLVTQNKLKFCSRLAILKELTCFQFIWCDFETVIERKQGIMVFAHYEQLNFLCEATLNIPIPFVVRQNGSQLREVKFHKIHNHCYFASSERNQSNGFLIHTKSATMYQKGMNIFKCKNEGFISYAFVCDGFANCPRNEDEETGFCHELNRTFRDGSERKLRRVTELHKSLRQTFSFRSPPNHKLNTIIGKDSAKQKACECLSRKGKQTCVENDLIVDCFTDGPEDEQLLLALLTMERRTCQKSGKIVDFWSCSKQNYAEALQLITSQNETCYKDNHLPCRTNYPKCFPFHKICSFMLEENRYLSPCRNGGHLVECQNFECNAQFKCARAYCVPWSYVCDSKWDCPEGEDETPGSGCGKPNDCEDMFKCTNTNKCVHLGDICNGIEDCWPGEDEFYCELDGLQCPVNCVCHTWTTVCQNKKDVFSVTYPSKVIVATNCALLLSGPWNMEGVLLIHILNHLVSGPYCMSFPYSLIHLHLENTRFQKVTVGCFQNLTQLVSLSLPSNNITVIDMSAFKDLGKLLIMNISHNPLKTISHHCCLSTARPKIFSLRGIFSHHDTLLSLSELKFQFLEVSRFLYCCLAVPNATCNLQVSWFYSCKTLLPNTSIQRLFYVMSTLLFITNMFCFLLHIALRRKNTKDMTISVIFVNLNDLLVCGYLTILWISDTYHSENFSLMQEAWKKSFACHTALLVSIWFSFQTPFVLCLLSYLRFCVVAYPLKNRGIFRWKTSLVTTFVLTNLIVFHCSLATVFTAKYTGFSVPTSLCMPFVDPSGTQVLSVTVTWLVMVLQTLVSVAIARFHWDLYRELKLTENKVKGSKAKESKKSFLLVQLLLITFSNMMCWYPMNVIYISGMFLRQYPLNLIYWSTVCVTPINSVINPVLFVTPWVRSSLKRSRRKNDKVDRR